MNLREIQKQVVSELMSSRMIELVMTGNITRSNYISYLSDVYCYASHSSQVIGIAGSRLVLSHPSLASYLFRHAQEELGHEKWVASDLKYLGLSEEEVRRLQPSQACHRMLGLEYLYAAHLNPVGLMGWMFVLESLGGKMGEGISLAIDKALKLDGKGLYFLQGHAEADTHHSEDLYKIISENVISEPDISVFTFMIAEATALYCDILSNALKIR